MEPISFRAEAAHYALLRRLAPSMRHHVVGILHPMVVLTELANRLIAADRLDIEHARDAIVKLRQHSRDATESTTGVLAWITGEESRTIGLHEGIAASLALIRTDSEVRGVRISHIRDNDDNVLVSRKALRTIVTASLIAAVDMRPAPSTIRVCACTDSHTATVRIDGQYPDQASSSDAYPSEDRLLSMDDLVVLAEVERVELRHTHEPFVILCRFPILV